MKLWSRRGKMVATGVGIVIMLASPGPVHADDAHRHEGGHSVEASIRLPKEVLQIADAAVIDHQGRELSFRKDVLGTGPVIVTFIYTACQTVCPITNAITQELQAELAKDGDDRTRLVSISIDPLNDTPAKLAEMAEAFDAGSNWTFVTSSVPEIASLLRSYGLRLGAVEDHDPMFLVGSGATDSYVRITGLPETEQLLQVVREVRAGYPG